MYFNAHAHLNLSQIGSPIICEDRSFLEWATQLIIWKQQAAPREEEGIKLGYSQLGNSDAIIDFAPIGCIDKLAEELPNWLPFCAVLGWRAEYAEQAIRQLSQVKKAAGIALHAPYSVHPELIGYAINKKVPISIHLAETLEELELLRCRTGAMLELHKTRMDRYYNPANILLGYQPLDYLKLLSVAPRVFIVHGNYLEDNELKFLAEHPHMSVVYCPRSHFYFRHKPYPLKKMLDLGVKVLLGTDSLASAPNLNMADEVAFCIKQHPDVKADIIHNLATRENADF